MKTKCYAFLLLLFAVCFALIPSISQPDAAFSQALTPTPDPELICEPGTSPNGIMECTIDGDDIYIRSESDSDQDSLSEDIGADTAGPDEYGYTWDDSGTLNWYDATGGTDAGMSGSSRNQAVQVTLPFPFDYYENTYSQVWIAGSGYLSFTDYSPDWPSQDPIPYPPAPNNVIAPFWSYFNLAGSGPTGRVYTMAGGTTPNQYFVVEWYQVIDDMDGDDQFTFQVVLFENGDIRFQYQTMSVVDSYICASAGIEDNTGLDGLNYLPLCGYPPSNLAVDFFRPGPSARVKLTTYSYASFGSPGQEHGFLLNASNNGDLGADTYDLTATSIWPATFYTADGTTPLTDTDSDGIVDTGSLPQGSSLDFIVRIDVPSDAAVGEYDQADITAQSSLDPSKNQTRRLQSAIPGNFGQVYQRSDDGAMSILLTQQDSSEVSRATPDGIFGYDPAVVEMTQGFAYFWTQFRSLPGDLYLNEIEFALLDKDGQVTKPASKLQDLSGTSYSTFDRNPAVDRNASGRIGVLWSRTLEDDVTYDGNENMYFAILDRSGDLEYGPENLTGNLIWGGWDDLNVPGFNSPRITATGDGRFVLVWQQYHRESGGDVDDIYYAIRESDGSPVVGITKLTADTPGYDLGFDDPATTAVSPDRVFISWAEGGWDVDISFTVLSSGGAVVHSTSDLTDDDGIYNRDNFDAVQLSDGHILAAWNAGYCFPDEWDRRIRFALLDDSYNRIGSPSCLPGPPESYYGDTYVSATVDGGGHAILTWTDDDWSNRFHIYYAMVDSSGVVTPAMSFLSGVSAGTTFDISSEGYGNTTYHPYTIFLPLILR